MDRARVIAWIRSRPWASAGSVVAALVFLFLAGVVLRTPSADRDWDPHLAHMPAITLGNDGGVALDPVIDWSYTAAGPASQGMTSFAADIDDLHKVWLMVEPQPKQSYAAHTLLLFEFADARMIGLTIEARLESHETYDALAGLFNNFELAYVWATPKELLTRRAVMLKKDVYVYPLNLTQEQAKSLLRGVIERTREVEAKPAFYNTFSSNCTNELAKVAKMDWHYSWVLTGYSPQHLHDLKLIPGEDFDSVRKSALMSAEIVAWNERPSEDFTRALVTELHKRFGS